MTNNINPSESIEAHTQLAMGQTEPAVIPPALDALVEERMERESIEMLRSFRDIKQDIEFRQIIGDYMESAPDSAEAPEFLANAHHLGCEPLFLFIPSNLVFDCPDNSDKAFQAAEAHKRLNPYFYWCAAAFIPDLNKYVFMYRKYYWIGAEIYRNATVVESFVHRSSIATALLNFIDMWSEHPRIQLDAIKLYNQCWQGEEFKEGTLGRFLAGVDMGIAQSWNTYQKQYESVGYYDLMGNINYMVSVYL
jgi:hypothetical protein